MFAGLTLVRQCSLGFAWFEKSTDLSVDSSNDDSVTIQSSASAFGFFGRFWAIIEYLDTNGVPGYQPGDTILSLYPLSRNLSDWKPIKRDTLCTNEENILFTELVLLLFARFIVC
jgi:hypothetical protein